MFDDFNQRCQRLKSWEQQSREKVNMVHNNSIKSTDSTNLQASMKKSREGLQKTSQEIDKLASACGQLGHQMLVDHLT